MTIGKAITLLIENYHKALSLDYINKPIAWALYQTWKIADKKERGRENE